MLIIQRPEIEAEEAEGNTQRFIISPLEPGFGHTLGNSLRRTLLSSIPGRSSGDSVQYAAVPPASQTCPPAEA